MHNKDLISLKSLNNSTITEEVDSNRTIKREVIEELKEIGVKTTAHAIPRILTRQWFLKIIWLFFMLSCIGLCAYTVINNIQEYLTYSVNTLVQVVPKAEIIYPTISVCNVNPLVTEESFKYISDYYSVKYGVELTSYLQFYELINRQNETIPNDIDWLLYRTYDPEFNQTLKQSFGFRFEEAMLTCLFKFLDCNLTYFDRFYHPKYGNCFRFNSGMQIQPAAIHDVDYGLKIAVFTGISDRNKAYFYEQADKGLVVIIDDQSTTSLEREGVLIKPGSFSNIVLSKSISTSLSQPYNDCRDSTNSVQTTIGREMSSLNMTYDRRNCFTLCRQKSIIDQIGCYDMRYPRLFNASPCSTRDLYDRLRNLTVDLSICSDECPFSCNTVKYDWVTSYADYPTYMEFKYLDLDYNDTLEKYFSGSYSYSDVRQTVASAFVYFETMSVVEITQSPSMVLTDLIANIGGTFGLFLGLSVLSFVEFVDLLQAVFVGAFKLYKVRRNRHLNC